MALTTAERSRRYWLKNKDSEHYKKRTRCNAKKKNYELKKYTIKYYSNGKMNCNCCDENIYKFLTVDHINGRKPHNHDRSMTGIKLLWWLKKNKYPKGFQILCYNCNCSRAKNGGICPHKI